MSSNSTNPTEIRRFGSVAFVFFGLLCLLGVWRHKPLPIYLFGLLSLLGLGFIIIPALLEPVYLAWLKIAHGIGRIITLFALALAYYLVITPVAWLKRLFGGIPLPLKPDPDQPTYWINRDEPVQPRERFSKRF